MSSGFGLYGKTSRCFPFFRDLQECLNSTVPDSQCDIFRADYFECLHGKKKYERKRELQEREEMIRTGKMPSDGHGGGHH